MQYRPSVTKSDYNRGRSLRCGLCLFVLSSLTALPVHAAPPDTGDASPAVASFELPQLRYQVVLLSGRSAVSLTNNSEILFTSGEIVKWDGTKIVYSRQAPCFELDPTITTTPKSEVQLGKNIVGENLTEFYTAGTPTVPWWHEALAMNDSGQILWSSRVVAGSHGEIPSVPSRGLYLFSDGVSDPIADTAPTPRASNKWRDDRPHICAINNKGKVLYQYTDRRSITELLWNPGKGDPVPVDSLTENWRYLPVGLNDIGSLVGTALQSPGAKRSSRSPYFAYFQDTDGKRQLLPVPSPRSWGHAFGVNNQDAVVGSLTTHRAVLWEKEIAPALQAGQPKIAWKMTDLNAVIPPDTGCELLSAVRINDRGEILAVGTYRGVPQSFLLVPVKHTDSDKKTAESKDITQEAGGDTAHEETPKD